MTIMETIALFGIMAALAALPGASVALVVARAATLGVANGIAVSIGIVLGDIVFILLAISGLSIAAEAMGGLFIVIKYLGALYLLWVGLTLLTSRNTGEISMEKPAGKRRNIIASILAGFILTMGDIKAIVFYVSLLPAFINLSVLNASDVFTIISVMTIGVGGAKVIYAISARKVILLARKHRLENAARKTAGGLVVGAGGYLIVKA